MVARLQSVISEEIRKQLLEHEGRECPDYLIACVGGGSNAAGTIYHYVNDPHVQIVLAEAGGKGIETGMTAATIALGKMGIIAGSSHLRHPERGRTDEEPIPSLPDWTIRASAPCTPTLPSRNVPSSSP